MPDLLLLALGLPVALAVGLVVAEGYARRKHRAASDSLRTRQRIGL